MDTATRKYVICEHDKLLKPKRDKISTRKDVEVLLMQPADFIH